MMLDEFASFCFDLNTELTNYLRFSNRIEFLKLSPRVDQRLRSLLSVEGCQVSLLF